MNEGRRIHGKYVKYMAYTVRYDPKAAGLQHRHAQREVSGGGGVHSKREETTLMRIIQKREVGINVITS